MKRKKSKNIFRLRDSAEYRIKLTDELYREGDIIQRKSWKPFWKAFRSFEELEAWKRRQQDPRLW